MSQQRTVIELEKVACRVCGSTRLNDGLKCPSCKSYQNPNIQLVGGRLIDVRYQFRQYVSVPARDPTVNLVRVPWR